MPSGRTRPPLWQVDVLPGLEDGARSEIEALARRERPVAVEEVGDGWLRVRDERRDLLERARTVVAVSRVVHVAVPRPRGLLGHEHLTRIAREARAATGGRPFTALRVVAAGAESTVMARLGGSLAAELGLPHDQADGDLVVRVVRDADRAGWEVHVRTTPRPLATRPWRVARFPGSLNAAIAAHLVRLAGPRPGDRAVNLACGAGTIAIEHLLAVRGATAVGVDLDGRRALPAAAANAAAAGVAPRLSLARADVARLPLAPASAAVLYADLPYGDKIRSATPPEELYTGLLAEAARVARPGARLVVITEDIARFARAVAGARSWSLRSRARVFQSGHRPEIFLLGD